MIPGDFVVFTSNGEWFSAKPFLIGDDPYDHHESLYDVGDIIDGEYGLVVAVDIPNTKDVLYLVNGILGWQTRRIAKVIT